MPTCNAGLWVLLGLIVTFWVERGDAFMMPPSGPRGPTGHFLGGDSNNGQPEPDIPTPSWEMSHRNSKHYAELEDEDDTEQDSFLEEDLAIQIEQEEFVGLENEGVDACSMKARGGSSSKELVKGSQATASKVSNFWKSSIHNVKSKVSNIFKSKEQKEQEELMEQLKTMPIRSVTVSKSKVLPADVVRVAVKRSGLIGNPLRTDRVQELARHLKRWYTRKGYILHSVTGATLKPETATAEITVEEPRVANEPVQITACKEMIVVNDDNSDDGTGEQLMTFREYVQKNSERRSFRHDRIDKKTLNTTFVPTKSRTKSSRIAKALGLKPGEPFCWDGARWKTIASCGIFSEVLRTSPVRLPDGSIRLDVYATEPPPRHLEYGLGKSLYTGSWEGEIDFEHQNLFGGGELVGVSVRRGTKDAEPSIRLRYSDEQFGLEGGYDFEVFTEFIGDTTTQKEDEKDGDKKPAISTSLDDYEQDDMLDRRGATFRLRNPISHKIIANSVASASVERTSTRTGLHESIGSATLTLGPFRRPLPMDARTSFMTTLTGGTRIGEKGDDASADQKADNRFLNGELKPYSLVSMTTRQVLPLSGGGRLSPLLALSHTLSTSTDGLPRHEAKALGVGAQIRGAKPDGRASSTVKGTAEIRFPLDIPRVGQGSVIAFGDWFVVQKERSSPFYSKSSVGIGFRKSVSGLPLKYDICYSSEGKIKAMFGLGPDFDA